MIAKSKRNIQAGTQYDGLISSSIGRTNTVKNFGDVDNTIAHIKQVAARTVSQTASLAPKLKGATLEETCSKVWSFLYDHVQYVRDRFGVEEIRQPSRTWSDRKGDCEDYSIFISTVLTNLNIPHKLRVTAYKADWQHIYIIVPVSGDLSKDYDQKRRTEYYVIDPVVDRFNYEVKYSKKRDIPMKIQELSGIGNASVGSLFDRDRRLARRAARKQKKSNKRAAKSTAASKANYKAPKRGLFRKVGRAAAKVQLAPLRLAWLTAMKLNIFNIAGRLQYAYVSPEVAQKNGYTPEKVAKLKAIAAKKERMFNELGGELGNFILAIQKGGKRRPPAGYAEQDAKSNHTGVGEPVTIASVTVIIGSLTALSGEIRNAIDSVSSFTSGGGAYDFEQYTDGYMFGVPGFKFDNYDLDPYGDLGIGEIGKTKAERQAKRAAKKEARQEKKAVKQQAKVVKQATRKPLFTTKKTIEKAAQARQVLAAKASSGQPLNANEKKALVASSQVLQKAVANGKAPSSVIKPLPAAVKAAVPAATVTAASSSNAPLTKKEQRQQKRADKKEARQEKRAEKKAIKNSGQTKAVIKSQIKAARQEQKETKKAIRQMKREDKKELKATIKEARRSDIPKEEKKALIAKAKSQIKEVKQEAKAQKQEAKNELREAKGKAPKTGLFERMRQNKAGRKSARQTAKDIAESSNLTNKEKRNLKKDLKKANKEIIKAQREGDVAKANAIKEQTRRALQELDPNKGKLNTDQLQPIPEVLPPVEVDGNPFGINQDMLDDMTPEADGTIIPKASDVIEPYFEDPAPVYNDPAPVYDDAPIQVYDQYGNGGSGTQPVYIPEYDTSVPSYTPEVIDNSIQPYQTTVFDEGSYEPLPEDEFSEEYLEDEYIEPEQAGMGAGGIVLGLLAIGGVAWAAFGNDSKKASPKKKSTASTAKKKTGTAKKPPVKLQGVELV